MAHSWAMDADSFSQLLPRSLERNRNGGLVPTKIVPVSAGSTAIDQMLSPSMGESNFSQLSPESSLR